MLECSSMRYLTLLMIMFSTVGCSGQWLYNRAKDFGEPFTGTFIVGPSATLGVKATAAAHILLGGGVHQEIGWYQGHWGFSEIESKGIPLNWAYPLEHGSGWMEVSRENSWDDYRYPSAHNCSGTHLLPFHQENPDADIKRSLDLEVTFSLFIGFRFGFSPVEFFDFALGLLGLDPAGDDIEKGAE